MGNDNYNMKLVYGEEGSVNANKLMMELIIMVALEVNSKKAIEILEENGVKIGYYLN